MQFTTVRNLIKALLTKRKLTGNFRLKRGNFKARSETDDVPTEVMKESNGILVEKKLWIINLKDGNEEILEDLTCLEGLMKTKRKLDRGLKPGTLNLLAPELFFLISAHPVYKM
jgi:hypothetical protein